MPEYRNQWVQCEICGKAIEIRTEEHGGVWICVDCHRLIIDPGSGFELDREHGLAHDPDGL